MIDTVVTKRPRPLWQKCYKKGYNFPVTGSIPQKKKFFFFVYSYRGKKMDFSYGGDEASTTIMLKVL